MSFIHAPNHNNEPKRDKRPSVVITRMFIHDKVEENTTRTLNFIRAKVESDSSKLFRSSWGEFATSREVSKPEKAVKRVENVPKNIGKLAKQSEPRTVEEPYVPVDPAAVIDLNEEVLIDHTMFDKAALEAVEAQKLQAELEKAFEAPAATEQDMPDSHPDKNVTSNDLDAEDLGEKAKELASPTKEAYAHIAETA